VFYGTYFSIATVLTNFGWNNTVHNSYIISLNEVVNDQLLH